MKKIIIVVFALICFAGIGAHKAQAQKFGHINFSELYPLIPGHDTAQAAYEKYLLDIQQQMANMTAEYEKKITEYQSTMNSMTPLIKASKEREIQDLQTRIEEFRNSATSDLSAKEMELTQPLIDKAKKAVEEVAKEHGFTYIFNSSDGLVLYAIPSDDIMELVKKKLNVK